MPDKIESSSRNDNMWDYQEFERVIDGVPVLMYTNRGAEKFIPSEEHMKYVGVLIFQFGWLFQLLLYPMNGSVRYLEDWKHTHVTRIKTHDRTERCIYCSECPATLLTIGTGQSDADDPVCDTCHRDIVSLMFTLHTTTEPKMVKAEPYIFVSEPCDVVAYPYHRLPTCTCIIGNECHTQHKYWCSVIQYASFAYRAAYAKWLCNLVLDSVDCVTDVKPMIVMYVLSGNDNAWNRF